MWEFYNYCVQSIGQHLAGRKNEKVHKSEQNKILAELEKVMTFESKKEYLIIRRMIKLSKLTFIDAQYLVNESRKLSAKYSKSGFVFNKIKERMRLNKKK